MSKLDTVIIILYFVVLLIIGLVSNKKQKGTEDYFVGGRKLNSLTIMVMWIAAWIGGASLVGSTGKAYDEGVTATWYIGAIAIGCLIFALSFSKIVKRTGDMLKNITYPELFEQRYDLRCRIICTITTILAYIAYAAGQEMAIGNILNVMAGWDLSTAFIIGTIIVVFYTALGGLIAIAGTNWVQTSLMILGVIVIGTPLALSAAGGWSNIQATVPSSHFNIGAWGWGTILGLIVTMTFTYFTAMDSYTRMFSAKSERVARTGTFLAVIIFAIIAVSITIIGLSTRVLFPTLEGGGSAMATLVKSIFPIGIKGLVLVGLLSGIMSVGAINILIPATNFAEDIYHRLINPKASEKQVKFVAIIGCVLIGVFGALLAWKMQDILNILYLAFTINSAALILPTISMFYWRKAHSQSAFWSTVFSLATVLFWYIGGALNWGSIFKLDPVWPGLIVSAIIFIPMSLIMKPNSKDLEKINKFIPKETLTR